MRILSKRMKQFTCFVFALLLLVGCLWTNQIKTYAAGANNADDKAESTYSYLIQDEARLLSNREKQSLVSYITPILPYGNVIISTVYLNAGQDYTAYTENLYYNTYGNEPGIIFNIDMGNRKITLSASTGMEKEIGKERDSIVDNVYTYATNEDYFGCIAECLKEVYTVLNDGQIAHTMKHIDNAIIALILALLLNFVFVFAKGKKKPSVKKTIGAVTVTSAVAGAAITKGNLSKEYSPSSSSSGGSSGGGGGGGFSGGSSSHGF